MDFISKLKRDREEKKIPESLYEMFFEFHKSYVDSLARGGIEFSNYAELFEAYLNFVKEQLINPFKFEPFHKKITHPFNYYKFGNDLFKPMVDKECSTLAHPENIEKIQTQLGRGENVILFANHQTEIDPQLLNITLEEPYPGFASEMIFVAGDRVITDPFAIPMSMGCNLLCIYSKRYMDTPPERKEEKLLHNQKTMKVMRELLAEGGKVIYVAPSGGRDRPNDKGELVLSPFDPKSIEMFRLMAKQSRQNTHFYPLSLKTYSILPPPDQINKEIGEIRLPKRCGAQIGFGDEIDMEHFPGSEIKDRHAKRSARAMHIFNLVKKTYAELP
ncbi:MAG: hypothetical protein S4CHLAM45_09150 [Chlamydiales bacterium]|nr:hypothetical protein [Chlamydiales bacterium]MCH9620533.1 hypothetical protein [Chlamydiales bacterium]MCH9623019.1 hypothetical protein [Chlamydiales bacterium]